jgi:hypothetical protein
MAQAENIRNRRASRRRTAKESTKVCCYRGPMGLGANLAVSAVEVSETGACLLVKAPLAKGDELEVNVVGIAHRRPIRKSATVVWCVTAGPDRWRVGVQFQGALRYADLHELAKS